MLTRSPAASGARNEQVNSDFYRAFSTKNISLMGDVWHNSPHVQCVHPGAKPLVGFDNIISMWSNMFQVCLRAYICSRVYAYMCVRVCMPLGQCRLCVRASVRVRACVSVCV